MKSIQSLVLAALMLLGSGVSLAASKVEVQVDVGKSAESTLNVRTDQGASCSSPSIGACGSCAISCPVGKAAECRPGRAVGNTNSAQASCVESPACVCR